MHATCLLTFLIIIIFAHSFAIPDTDEIATFFVEDDDFELSLLTNNMPIPAQDDPIFLSDNSLFPSDTDSPVVIAQGGPALDGSSLEFNDAIPGEQPTCTFPKALRCCPIDNFSRCIFFNPGHPLCMNLKTLYCCQNIPVKNDEGDDIGWDFQCDSSVTRPDWLPIVDDVLDFFIRTPVGNVLESIPSIPSIPLVPEGDNLWGFPK